MLGRWLLLCCLALVGATVFAVETDGVQSIAATLSEKSRNTVSISGTFEQEKTISVLPLPLRSAGAFQYHRDRGLLWQTLHPVESTLRIDRNGLELDGSALNQMASQQVAAVMLAVFSGDISLIEAQFSLQESGSPENWKILLAPTSELLQKKITAIEISGGEFTEQVNFTAANGDSSRMHLSTEQIVYDQAQ